MFVISSIVKSCSRDIITYYVENGKYSWWSVDRNDATEYYSLKEAEEKVKLVNRNSVIIKF